VSVFAVPVQIQLGKILKWCAEGINWFGGAISFVLSPVIGLVVTAGGEAALNLETWPNRSGDHAKQFQLSIGIPLVEIVRAIARRQTEKTDRFIFHPLRQ
jgi:hypothetical protein